MQYTLLPTPRATDGTKGCPGQRGSRGDLTLPSTAVRLDPTPQADSPAGAGGPDEDRWGRFAAAVARWEHLIGRPAPPPSQPGRHGTPVLAPPFVEWLMGLPDQWVTHPDLRIPRTRALRVLGNGVVPQHAIAALCQLLNPSRWPRT
ncbi:hypothetical protein ABT369_19640 [Dactylosporangium sp. NPDC000244]|uniref:hypothetical protein n=1 Tax=Dactylosporangium sp. NPDC000244 TaxID=3154365 RepID=UPI0033312F61